MGCRDLSFRTYVFAVDTLRLAGRIDSALIVEERLTDRECNPERSIRDLFSTWMV